MIRKFLERRHVKKVFGKIIEPATVDALLRGERPSIKCGPIEFVLALVEDLRTQLAGDNKIVHGGAEGYFGLFGSRKPIMNYGFWMPQFDQVLGTLARLEYGRVEQFIC